METVLFTMKSSSLTMDVKKPLANKQVWKSFFSAKQFLLLQGIGNNSIYYRITLRYQFIFMVDLSFFLKDWWGKGYSLDLLEDLRLEEHSP